MLLWMAMGTSGMTSEGLCAPIPACLPEIDIRPAFVILPAGLAHAIFSAYFIILDIFISLLLQNFILYGIIINKKPNYAIICFIRFKLLNK